MTTGIEATRERTNGIGNGAAVEARLAARALKTLQPEQRRLVAMSVLQGLSHSEIAEATRMPLGTVKSTLRRALLSVRESLQPAPTARPEVSS